MTAAPLQLVNAEPEKQEPARMPEWVKLAGVVVLLILLYMLALHLDIVNRHYGPGRR